MLLSRKVDAIRLATVSDDGIAGNSYPAGRRQDPDALVSEPVDVRRDSTRRRDPEPIGGDEIVRTRGMHIQHEDHWRRMCEFVGQVKARMDFHDLYSLWGTGILISRSAIAGSVAVGQWKPPVAEARLGKKNSCPGVRLLKF